jgi:DNA-binding NarL/FixJ family response regulator
MSSVPAPYRVLLVDDAPTVREGLRWLLENEPDLEVVGEACNGLEALQGTMALMPDIIILDIDMPVMDGFEVARAIKAALDPPLILFVSVHGESEFRERARAAGGDGYAEKGKGWPELIAELRELVKHL